MFYLIMAVIVGLFTTCLVAYHEDDPTGTDLFCCAAAGFTAGAFWPLAIVVLGLMLLARWVVAKRQKIEEGK